MSNTVKHEGFDLFFQNMSNKKAKQFISVVNSMNKTMKGHPLKFKLNKEMSNSKSTAITVMYPAVTDSMTFIIGALKHNRMIAEAGLEAFGWSEVEYTGSEFYIIEDPKTFQGKFNTAIDELKNQPAGWAVMA